MKNSTTEVSALSVVPEVTSTVAMLNADAPKVDFKLRLKQPAFWNTPNPVKESALLEHWKQKNLRQALEDARAGAPKYWLLDGPPYANGEAHLGHLLNKTLKDVTARYQHLLGKQVLWRAGWDCHGLPLELAVEKRSGAGAKTDPVSFMRACRDEAHTWQQSQATGMQRLGLVADFEKPWLTMDPLREAASLGLLKELWEAGLLVERYSPVHWCPACQSALAASELEKTEKLRKEAFFVAKLTTASTKKLSELTGQPFQALHVMSWTTTPWTLWANAAFAHPEEGPVTLVTLKSGHVALMAVAARNQFVTQYGELWADAGYALDGVLDFSQFGSLGLQAVSPLSKRESPLVKATFALQGEGSGFVHVAPAFGADDFSLHETNGVRLDCHVGTNGRLVSTDPDHPLPAALEDANLETASEESCNLLFTNGLLVNVVSSLVEVQTCWRHKKPVFYRASQQWALDLHKSFDGCPEGLAARATAALSETAFLPDNKAKTPLVHMLATRRFWTLSRDRLWGLPLPFFRHESTNVLHPDTAQFWTALVDAVKTQGVEAWQNFPTPFGYRKTTQTVDVWFDSGAAWHSAGEAGLNEPDMGLEGQDQTRGWYLSSFLLHAFKSAAPAFKTVMTHSFVVGEDGLKLSKSKGGAGGASAVTPAAVFAKEGADAFRLWVCAQNVGDEARWGATALKQASQDLKDWRSFLRFLLANMAEEPCELTLQEHEPMEQLALSKAAAVRDEWKSLMSVGQFNKALQVLSSFRQWASTEWFELNKRTLYCARDDDDSLVSLQVAFQAVFALFVRMLAPVLPFAAEEAYLAWPRRPDSTVFKATLPDWEAEHTTDAASAQALLDWRRGYLPLVEEARGLVEKGVPVALVFSGKVPLGLDDKALRAVFPNTYPTRDGRVEDLAESAGCDSAGVFAGRANSAYQPVRCARCRGYFRGAFSRGDCCDECLSEMR